VRRFGKDEKVTLAIGGLRGPDGIPIQRRGLARNWFRDTYHFVVRASWPSVLLMVTAAFLTLNALFALGYLITGGVANARPHSYSDAFFFSVQTLSTIGYGVMVPQSATANTLMTMEALCGGFGLALMTGLVFTKFSLPTSRVRFSQVAVIGNYHGQRCLMFRMANERDDRIVQPQLQVVLLRAELEEGEGSFIRVHDVPLVRDRHAFLSLTWSVMHIIDERSPLHDATPDSMARDRSAVVVSMVGLDEGVSQTVFAHHTYQANDIRWDARFVDVIKPNRRGGWVVDYSLFDDVI
jgi:inward rectifier potassium channel